jgi:hypothetical protein
MTSGKKEWGRVRDASKRRGREVAERGDANIAETQDVTETQDIASLPPRSCLDILSKAGIIRFIPSIYHPCGW